MANGCRHVPKTQFPICDSRDTFEEEFKPAFNRTGHVVEIDFKTGSSRIGLQRRSHGARATGAHSKHRTVRVVGIGDADADQPPVPVVEDVAGSIAPWPEV
jgi:hypothetical protein